MKTFSIRTPAKINLALWILGRRPDGYHEILTLFLKVPIFDEIFIAESKRLSVVCDNCPSGRENLVFRAVELLSEAVGRRIDVEVKILKKIPVGGGLGGGSSDAAAVLKALNELYGFGLSLKKLMEIGAQLGADVPFFLLDAPMAIGRGIGDVLEPVNLRPPLKIKIYCPPIRVSTAWAYSQVSASGAFTPKSVAENRLKKLLDSLQKGKFEGLARFVENDFEKILIQNIPEIGNLLSSLRRDKNALAAGVSGSGACCFSVHRASVFSAEFCGHGKFE